MPTQIVPQPPAPEPSRKPAEPRAEPSPSIQTLLPKTGGGRLSLLRPPGRGSRSNGRLYCGT